MAELVPAKQKIDTIRAFLEKSKPQIAMALPKHMNADRLARIAMTSILRNPRLLECSPQSLVGAVIQCSQLGLEPDDIRGEAYLVPFRNNKKGTIEVQLIAGFKGLMDLARRSGKITAIYAEVVHVKDTFSYRLGTEQFLHHVKSNDENPGEVIQVYALARFPNNQCQFIVLSMADVEKSRQRSKAKDSGPWETDFEAMAKKTALRQLCKYLPSSVELATAVALDERAEAGIPQDLEVIAGEVIETEATKGNGTERKGLSDLTQKLKSKEPPPQPTTETTGDIINENEEAIQRSDKVQSQHSQTRPKAQSSSQELSGQTENQTMYGLRQDVPSPRDGFRSREGDQTKDTSATSEPGTLDRGSTSGGREVRSSMRELSSGENPSTRIRQRQDVGINQGAGQPVGGKLDPVLALLSDIESVSTRAGIYEFDRQLNKRLAEAGIKGNDLLRITTALNKKKAEIQQAKEEGV